MVLIGPNQLHIFLSVCSSMAKQHGFSVSPYCYGHGIGSVFHALPDICHVGNYHTIYHVISSHQMNFIFLWHKLRNIKFVKEDGKEGDSMKHAKF